MDSCEVAVQDAQAGVLGREFASSIKLAQCPVGRSTVMSRSARPAVFDDGLKLIDPALMLVNRTQ